MIHQRTRCCAERSSITVERAERARNKCNANWCNAYDRLARVAGRKPERGWSSDADFFDCFFVKKLGQERFRRNAQERGVVVSLKRICQAVRSMVSCTKGHVEKFLKNDDADDQFKD